MPSPQTLVRMARPLSQSFTSSFTASSRSTFRSSNFQSAFRQSSRRWASDAAGTGATAGGATGSGAGAGAGAGANAGEGWFKRMWNSPIGFKTVHFWAPVMKWAIVIAGISDFGRPAEQLSLTQNAALTATGAIWTRWCLIIKPRNVLLATVNFFLGCVGVIQVSRILMYNASQKNQTAAQQIEAAKADVKEVAVGIKQEVKAAVN